MKSKYFNRDLSTPRVPTVNPTKELKDDIFMMGFFDDEKITFEEGTNMFSKENILFLQRITIKHSNEDQQAKKHLRKATKKRLELLERKELVNDFDEEYERLVKDTLQKEEEV